MVKLRTVPDIEEYATIQDAADDPRVPYTAYWVRRLCQEGKITCRKIGPSERGQWLVHLPSLVTYARQMDDLGTKKHHPD